MPETSDLLGFAYLCKSRQASEPKRNTTVHIYNNVSNLFWQISNQIIFDALQGACVAISNTVLRAVYL